MAKKLSTTIRIGKKLKMEIRKAQKEVKKETGIKISMTKAGDIVANKIKGRRMNG